MDYFVLPTEEADIKEITIYSEKTFGKFRRTVSSQTGINSDDLILTGQQEYDAAKYNSQKISTISGIYDHNYKNSQKQQQRQSF